MTQSNKRRGTVPVCFITDNRYALPTMVAIRSLYLNSGLFRRPRIIVFAAEDLTQENRRALCRLGPEVTVVDMRQTEWFMQVRMRDTHVTSAALYKFRLAEILTEYDEALYIDSDVLVLRDLGSLTATELGGAYAAAVETFTAQTYLPDLLRNLKVQRYFSSGVMLLNLKRMREERICDRLIDYRLNGWNFFVDQDALNAVFREQVVYLPPEYNLQYTAATRLSPQEACRLYGAAPAGSWDEMAARSTILHFASSQKPWQYDNIWKADLWLYYYNRLPADIRSDNPLSRVHSRRKYRLAGGTQSPERMAVPRVRHTLRLALGSVVPAGRKTER